jgi:hypothetical protein
MADPPPIAHTKPYAISGSVSHRTLMNSGERSFFGSPSFSDVALFGHLNRP